MRTIEQYVTDYDNLPAQFFACLGLVGCYLLSHLIPRFILSILSKWAFTLLDIDCVLAPMIAWDRSSDASACNFGSCSQHRNLFWITKLCTRVCVLINP